MTGARTPKLVHGNVHLAAHSRDDVAYPMCVNMAENTVGTTTTDKAAVTCKLCRRVM